LSLQHIEEKLTVTYDLLQEVNDKIKSLQPAINEFDFHHPIAEHQKEHYEDQLEKLQEGQAIVIIDFAATYQLNYRAVESHDEWFDKCSV
jgi:ABC-type uncharacterized transport system YnjBCD substrate-binding protein